MIIRILAISGACLTLGVLAAPATGLAAERGSPPQPAAGPAAREPDRLVDGFPVWIGDDHRLDRVVVLVEGFDPFNRNNARAVLRMVAPAAAALAEHGLDILVLDFPDSRLSPDALAPQVRRAVLAAGAASGRPAAVVGLSAGGIAARWALAEAEASGEPLPAALLLLFDSPNRGAWLNPGLQALVTRYGGRAEREAITSAGFRAIVPAVANVQCTKRA